MGTRIQSLVSNLPRWTKIATAVGVLGSLLYSTFDVLAATVTLPTKVERHERWIESTEPLLKFLVCRAIESDTGGDGRACLFLLRSSPYYNEFVQLGLIP